MLIMHQCLSMFNHDSSKSRLINWLAKTVNHFDQMINGGFNDLDYF